MRRSWNAEGALWVSALAAATVVVPHSAAYAQTCGPNPAVYSYKPLSNGYGVRCNCDGTDSFCDGSCSEASFYCNPKDPSGGDLEPGEQRCCVSAGKVNISVPNGCIQPGGGERCDGIDNTCDGAVDEGFGDLTCGQGACRRTVNACLAGQPQACVPGPPSSEVCNGLDDDCDGEIDEGFDVGSACNVGEGACAAVGQRQCAADGTTECVPLQTPQQPSPEVCGNSVDEDCNGLIEDCSPPPPLPGPDPNGKQKCPDYKGDPVDMASGNVSFGPLELISLRTPRGQPLKLNLSYSSAKPGGIVGRGWTISTEQAVFEQGDLVVWQHGAGGALTFKKPTAWAADEVGISFDAPLPLPDPSKVVNALDGSNVGLYLARTGVGSCGTACTVDTVSPRVVLADGTRHVFGALSRGPSPRFFSEDAFGNREIVGLLIFTGGLPLASNLYGGDRDVSIGYDFYPSPFPGELVGVRALHLASHLGGEVGRSGVVVDVSPDGFLEEVCTAVGAAQNSGQGCLARRSGSACEGLRTLWRFSYQSNLLHEVRDETCNVVERDSYTLLNGRQVLQRTEGPTEIADFDWTLSSSGIVTGAMVKTYLQPANPPPGNQQPAFVTSNFGVDLSASRVQSLNEACSCGAPVARTWARGASGARAMTSHSTGVAFKRTSSFDFLPNPTANPHGYNLPTQSVEVDQANPRPFPVPTRTRDFVYGHPLYRRATEVTSDGPGDRRTRIVHDFDDDDPAHPCIEGAGRRAGNPTTPNELPTAFLCTVHESSGTPGATSRVTRYRWDLWGRLLQVTRPGGDSTHYEYYPDDDPDPRLAGMLKATVSSGQGTAELRTRFEGYHFTGQPKRVYEPSGRLEAFEYDERGRLTSRITADGAETAITWEANGKPATVTLPRGQVLRHSYGPFGRLTKAELFAPGGSPLLFERRFAHDQAGNVILQEDFDARVQKVTRRVQRDFDQGRRVTREFNDQGGVRVSTYEDALLTRVVDEANKVTLFGHDSFGRLRRVEAPGQVVTSYEFDPRDNLTLVTDANGNATRYTFDGFDSLLAVESKDTGTTLYGYTVDGLVSRRIDANDALQAIETSYDGLRRPLLVEKTVLELQCTSGSTCEQPYRVLSRTPLTRYAWDAPDSLGRLWRVEDYVTGGTIASDFSWDAAGRLQSETVTRPGLSRSLTLSYGHHPGGGLQYLAYPPQLPGQLPMFLVAALGPDDEAASLTFGGVPVATSVEHYAFGGGLKRFTRGNGLSTTIEQDLDGRRTAVTGGPISLSYTFDRRGLPVSVAEVGDVPRARVFGHDDLQRLESVSFSASAAPGSALLLGETFSYDKAGNRLLKTRNDGKTFRSVFDWKAGTSNVPDNNLLRSVIDPIAGGECEPRQKGDKGKPECPPRGLANHELAGLEAGWQALLNDARDIFEVLPLLSEAELRGKTVAWIEKLRTLITDYRLSSSTLQLLLFSSTSGPHNFAEVLAAFVQRRFDGMALDGTDWELLKRMLELARKVPVRKAAELDPIWDYGYSPSGDVTEVVMTMPLSELKPGAPEYQRSEVKYCYEYNARRQLVRVRYATRYDLSRPPTPPCGGSTGLTTIAEYRYTSNNLRVYSKTFGLEKHLLFSPQGQVLAEANPEGVIEKAYLYLEGEPLAQVVRRAGTGSSPPLSGGLGCSSSGGGEAPWLATAVLALLLLLRRPRSRTIAASAAVLWLSGCDFQGGFAVDAGQGKTWPRLPKPDHEGARLEDPIYYFHNDRLGTPVRLTDEAGRTVWRAEYRAFGDLQSLETDPDRDGVAVENNIRFPGQYDEALGTLMFQQGPYYNGHRWYFPGDGRYGQGDPLAVTPDMAMVFWGRGDHVYGYARNSPLSFVDPTGLQACPPGSSCAGCILLPTGDVCCGSGCAAASAGAVTAAAAAATAATLEPRPWHCRWFGIGCPTACPPVVAFERGEKKCTITCKWPDGRIVSTFSPNDIFSQTGCDQRAQQWATNFGNGITCTGTYGEQ